MFTKNLADMGVAVFRYKNAAGGMKPHLCVRFRDNDGVVRTFAVDTTRIPGKNDQPDAYLITHAHSDHYGKSAMNAECAWCSYETARALEIRYERPYEGNRFVTGTVIDINGVSVKTYPVYHAPGASAFFWENDVGTKILVTGDVKDAAALPKCDVLITEASYGDPDDRSCHFSEDPDGLINAVSENIGKRNIALGAYDFGKAQKTVSLLREMGYCGPIAMNGKTLELTKCFVEDPGELVPLSGNSGSGNGSSGKTTGITKDVPLMIVPPTTLPAVSDTCRKYVLTCRADYPYPIIRLSDHLDVSGLSDMVFNCDPEMTIVYHPNKGNRPEKFNVFSRFYPGT